MKKEDIRYFSDITGREMHAVVMTPEGNVSERIVYCLHGYGGDEYSLSCDPAVENAVNECLSDCTVVFPYIYINREREKCTALDLINARAYDNFIFELCSFLDPIIREKYRTKEEKRVVCGFSMGGREALYIGVMRPDMFSAVGASCPAPGILPTENKALNPGMLRRELLRPCTSKECYPSILISYAENDNIVLDAPQEYSAVLHENSVPHRLHKIENGIHDNLSFAEHIKELSKILSDRR